MDLSLQEKHLTVSVARDKITVLKAFVCHRELDSALVLKDAADELNGDINECDIFNTVK